MPQEGHRQPAEAVHGDCRQGGRRRRKHARPSDLPDEIFRRLAARQSQPTALRAAHLARALPNARQSTVESDRA